MLQVFWNWNEREEMWSAVQPNPNERRGGQASGHGCSLVRLYYRAALIKGDNWGERKRQIR
jgi:hypothetical protein